MIHSGRVGRPNRRGAARVDLQRPHRPGCSSHRRGGEGRPPRALDEAEDALLLLPGHERAHRRRRVERLADDDGGHLLEHSFDNSVVDRPLDQ